MNTKTKIAVAIPAFLCCCLLYYCLILNNQLTEAKHIQSEMKKNAISDTDFLCYSNRIAEIVQQFQKFITRKESDSLLVQAPVLIYRYSQFICDDCIQAELEELRNLQNEIGKEYIWILPAYDDTRNNRIKLLNMLHYFNYRIIPLEEFSMPADCDDKELRRFFAFINKEGNLSMVFFPEASKLHLTQNYFSEIKKKLENEQ